MRKRGDSRRRRRRQLRINNRTTVHTAGGGTHGFAYRTSYFYYFFFGVGVAATELVNQQQLQWASTLWEVFERRRKGSRHVSLFLFFPISLISFRNHPGLSFFFFFFFISFFFLVRQLRYIHSQKNLKVNRSDAGKKRRRRRKQHPPTSGSFGVLCVSGRSQKRTIYTLERERERIGKVITLFWWKSIKECLCMTLSGCCDGRFLGGRGGARGLGTLWLIGQMTFLENHPAR